MAKSWGCDFIVEMTSIMKLVIVMVSWIAVIVSPAISILYANNVTKVLR